MLVSKRPAQLVLRDVLEVLLRHLEGGVVHQDVELSVGRDRSGHGVLAVGRLAHVQLEHFAATPRVFHQPARRRRVVIVLVVKNGDIGAFEGERQGYRSPDSGIRPGDQGRLSGEFSGRLIFGEAGVRFRPHLALARGIRLLLAVELVGLRVGFHGCLLDGSRSALASPFDLTQRFRRPMFQESWRMAPPRPPAEAERGRRPSATSSRRSSSCPDASSSSSCTSRLFIIASWLMAWHDFIIIMS